MLVWFFIYFGLYNSLRNVFIYLIKVEHLPMASDIQRLMDAANRPTSLFLAH